MNKELTGWRKRLNEIVFETTTFEGKLFDGIILTSIVLSVIAVILESVVNIHSQYGHILRVIEWFFTILFTIEYILRIISTKKSFSYVKSFDGIVDLIAILPTYLSVFYFGLQSLLVVRIFRLLRLFKTLKMVHYVTGANELGSALRASKTKIWIFLTVMFSVVVLMSAMMYIVEGPTNGFTNIPVSMYWTVVTMTTVGYGGIVPQTILGKVLANILMVLGYGLIAVPMGIVSAELFKANKDANKKTCDNCGNINNDFDARHCKVCGKKLSIVKNSRLIN
jgi:voltage-gated potassium channel